MARRKEKSLEQLQDEYYEDLGAPPPLSQQQTTFVEQLLTGKNISVAALAAHVSRRSAVRWMRPDHPVANEYERQRLALHDAFVARIATLHELGLDTLEALLTEKEPNVRLAALKFLQETWRKPEPRPVEILQDEEVQARKENMLSSRTYEREGWLSDNPLEYFREEEEQDEGAV